MENLIPIQKDMELLMKIWKIMNEECLNDEKISSKHVYAVNFSKTFKEGQQPAEDMMIKYQKREKDNE